MKTFLLVALLGLVVSQTYGEGLTKDDFKALEELMAKRQEGGPEPEPLSSGMEEEEEHKGAENMGFGHQALGFLDMMGHLIEAPSSHCLERLGLPPAPEQKGARRVHKDEVMQVLGKVAGVLENMGDKFEETVGHADRIKAMFEDLANGLPVDQAVLNQAHVDLINKVKEIHDNAGKDAQCGLQILFPLSARMQLFHTEGFAQDFKCRRTYELLLGLILVHSRARPGVTDPKDLHDVVLPTDCELRVYVRDDAHFWGKASQAIRDDVHCLANEHKQMRDGILAHQNDPLDNPGDAVQVVDHLIYFTLNTGIDRELLMAAVGHLFKFIPEQGPAEYLKRRSYIDTMEKNLNNMMTKQ